MAAYTVTVPIVGVASIDVEANSEDEAIREAIDAVSFDNIDTWEAVRKIVSGNVFHGSRNEAEAVKYED